MGLLELLSVVACYAPLTAKFQPRPIQDWRLPHYAYAEAYRETWHNDVRFRNATDLITRSPSAMRVIDAVKAEVRTEDKTQGQIDWPARQETALLRTEATFDRVFVFERATDLTMVALDGPNAVSHQAISPDERTIAVAFGGVVVLWDLYRFVSPRRLPVNPVDLWVALAEPTLQMLALREAVTCQGAAFVAWLKEYLAAPLDRKATENAIERLKALIEKNDRIERKEEIQWAAANVLWRMEEAGESTALPGLINTLLGQIFDDDYFVRERSQTALELLEARTRGKDRKSVTAAINERLATTPHAEVRARLERAVGRRVPEARMAANRTRLLRAKAWLGKSDPTLRRALQERLDQLP